MTILSYIEQAYRTLTRDERVMWWSFVAALLVLFVFTCVRDA